jgi:hypothetical protein
MLSAAQGQRPSLPPPYSSKIRGLSDVVWDLVTVCWSHNPLDRPTADHVVEQLRALPNRPVDERPIDDFTANFSQAPYHVEHPFSILAAATQTLLGTQHLNASMSNSYASHIATRGSRFQSNPRPYVPRSPSMSDDDDPPSWTERYEDSPSLSQGYRDPPSNTRGYSEPQPSQTIVQPPQWPGGISRPQQPYSQSSPSVLNRSMPVPRISSILHITLDVPLDRALTTFQTYISPTKRPVEWVVADIRHVNSIVEDYTLTKSVEIRQARIPGFLLFPVSCCLL